MADQKKGNPLVAGAVLAGVAVTAAVLAKKENRDKAMKLVGNVAKKGKKFLDSPQGKAVVGAAATKVVQDGAAKLSGGNSKK